MNLEEEKGGLAKKVAALGKLTKLHSAISTAVESAKVPVKETRKLLKAKNERQAKNTALFQFMRNLFQEMGLGKLDIVEKKNFKIQVVIKECQVTSLYPDIEDRKTCYITSDALSDFFTEDLGIPTETVEVECENIGDLHCKFEVEMQPLAVYEIALDKTDDQVIEHLKTGADTSTIAQEMGLNEEELDYRMDLLKSYHIITNNNKLTEIGQTYYRYGQSVIEETHEDEEPPWKAMSKITSKIADSESFAEAIRESAGKDGSEDVSKSEIVNLANKAEESQSFAQLVSEHVKKDEEDEEN